GFFPCPDAVAGFKSSALRHLPDVGLAQWRGEPPIARRSFHAEVSLHFELEQAAGAKMFGDFTNTTLDQRLPGNMVEYRKGKCEVEHEISQHVQIPAVGLVDPHVRQVRELCLGEVFHLTADV